MPDDDKEWEEIPAWDLPEDVYYDREKKRIIGRKGGEFDFEHDRIIGKSGRVYENVQVNLDDVRRWLKDSRH